MYYYLTREVKRRIIQELHTLFRDYPDLNKMKVTDKFPIDERPQYGVVVKNTSGESLPLAADNYISEVVSHCFVAKLKGKKGLFLDWVREDEQDITVRVTDDVSSQVVLNTATFTVMAVPVQGKGTVDPAISPRQLHATVNGVKTEILEVQHQTVILASAPPSGASVLITYWKRNLAPSGVYYIDLFDVDQSGGGQVMVDPLYNVGTEIIKRATGKEISFQLEQFPVFHNTFELAEVVPEHKKPDRHLGPPTVNPNHIIHPWPQQETILTPGVHYTLDEETGLITFLPAPENPGTPFVSIFDLGATSLIVSSSAGLVPGQAIFDLTTPGNLTPGTTITSIIPSISGIELLLSSPTLGESSETGDTLAAGGQTLRYNADYKVYYRVQGPSMGPFPVHRLESRNHILPGVVLAFSQWFEKGDKLVVIVTDNREPVSKEYGGNFDMSITMDVYSRDPVQREFIADLVAMQFWAVLKPRFDAIGLLLKSVSMSGETEDMYDENTDTPYYMHGIDLSITADWRLYIPIVLRLKQIIPDLDLILSSANFKVHFQPGPNPSTEYILS